MRRVCLLLGILLPVLSSGQTPGLLPAEDRARIHAAVRDAVYIIRQDYYLKDVADSSRKPLGLNKKPYFGRFYYFGLKVGLDLLTDATVLHPWTCDSNYAVVRDSVRYKPMLGARAVRSLTDSSFRNYADIPPDSGQIRLMSPDSSLAVLFMPSLPGLLVDTFSDIRSDSSLWYWTLKIPGMVADPKFMCFDSIPGWDYEVQRGRHSPSQRQYVTRNYYSSSSVILGIALSSHPSLGRMDLRVHGLIIRKSSNRFLFRRAIYQRGRPGFRTSDPVTPPENSNGKKGLQITGIESNP